MALGSKLLRNSVFGAVARLWQAVTTFLLMPYMLHMLGSTSLGVFQVAMSAIGYFGFGDVGIGPALSKNVSECVARNDRDGLRRTMSTGLVFYLLLATVNVLVGIALAGPFLSFIKAPAQGRPEYVAMAMLLVGAAAMATLNNAFRGPLIGLQRMDIFNAIELASSVTFVILVVTLLTTGWGVKGVALASFFQTLLPLPLLIYTLRKLLPDIPLTPRYASRSTMRTLLRFGLPVAAPSAAIVFQGQAERIIMSRLLGPGTVGYYSFGARISEVWRGVVQYSLLTLVPASAGMGAVGQHERVKQLYERAAKFVLTIVFGIGLCLFAITPVLMVAWLGERASEGYGTSMRALRYLSLATMAYLAPSVGIGIARGMNVLWPDVASSVVLVVGELSLGIALGRQYGYVGILTATLITMCISAVTSITLIHRLLRLGGLWDVLRLYAWPLLIAGLASLPVGLVNHAYREEIVHAGSLGGRVLRLAPLLFGEVAVFAGLYLMLIRLTRYLTPADVSSLRAAVKGARTAHLTTDSGEPVT